MHNIAVCYFDKTTGKYAFISNLFLFTFYVNVREQSCQTHLVSCPSYTLSTTRPAHPDVRRASDWSTSGRNGFNWFDWTDRTATALVICFVSPANWAQTFHSISWRFFLLNCILFGVESYRWLSVNAIFQCLRIICHFLHLLPVTGMFCKSI
jgi:hypothetical protein